VAYAKGTTVSVARTKAEIEESLEKFGATSIVIGTQPDRGIVMFELQGRRFRFTVKYPDLKKFFVFGANRNQHTAKLTDTQLAQTKLDQAKKERWRLLAMLIKIKLEAIGEVEEKEDRLELFKNEFLAYTVLPDNSTVGEWAEPHLIETYKNNTMLPMLPEGGKK